MGWPSTLDWQGGQFFQRGNLSRGHLPFLAMLPSNCGMDDG